MNGYDPIESLEGGRDSGAPHRFDLIGTHSTGLTPQNSAKGTVPPLQGPFAPGEGRLILFVVICAIGLAVGCEFNWSGLWQHSQAFFGKYGPEPRMLIVLDPHFLSPAIFICSFFGMLVWYPPSPEYIIPKE